MNKQSMIPKVTLAISGALIISILLPVTSSSVPIGTVLPVMPHSRVNSSITPVETRPRHELRLNYWIPIPAWLAGTWQTSKQTILSAYDNANKAYVPDLPKEITISRTSKIGSQQDSHGGIWHLGAPNTRIIETDKYTESQQIESIHLLTSTPTMVSVRAKAQVVRISKPEHELLASFKEETTATYTRLGDGSLISDFHINDFDNDGHPIYSSRTMCAEKKVKEFQAVDEDKRGDLRSSFHEFLLDTGRVYLIPHLK